MGRGNHDCDELRSSGDAKMLCGRVMGKGGASPEFDCDMSVNLSQLVFYYPLDRGRNSSMEAYRADQLVIAECEHRCPRLPEEGRSRETAVIQKEHRLVGSVR